MSANNNNSVEKLQENATQNCSVNGEVMDLGACIKHHFEVYFKDLGENQPSNLHQMLLAVAEKPLLEMVMEKTRHNQSMASDWLGINRATLRKKLQQYDLL